MGADRRGRWVRPAVILLLCTYSDPGDLRVFSMPYPLSSRCELPMEDPTNRGFCRPLPVDLFPIPVRPEMPREGESVIALNWLQESFATNLLYF